MAVYRPKYQYRQKGRKRRKLRQSAVWWVDFTFYGKRIKESTGTTHKTLALEVERRRRVELERALTGLPTEAPENRIRGVSEALAVYEKAYPVGHRAKSIELVEDRAIHVKRLLGGLLLPDLTQERVTGYMRMRQTEGVSSRTINLELSILSRAIGQTWKVLWPKVKKLEENRDVGRALEREEEQRILEAAARSQSRLIYPYLVLLAWTGMRADEGRRLQWLRVDFEVGQVTVGKAKTEAGTGRAIPMGATLRAVLEHHAAWYAGAFGPIDPGWYVFPQCRRNTPVDPREPVGSLQRAWEGVRAKTGVDCRLHDLRHSFCTKMAEAGVPEGTMLDMMGHMSAAMLRRYSHIRAQARREAITALEERERKSKFSPGHVQESPQVGAFELPKKAVTH
jgi:integrase